MKPTRRPPNSVIVRGGLVTPQTQSSASWPSRGGSAMPERTSRTRCRQSLRVKRHHHRPTQEQRRDAKEDVRCRVEDLRLRVLGSIRARRAETSRLSPQGPQPLNVLIRKASSKPKGQDWASVQAEAGTRTMLRPMVFRAFGQISGLWACRGFWANLNPKPDLKP